MPTHDHSHDHPHVHSDAPEPALTLAPVDPAQESLVKALRSGFRMLVLIMVVLLVAYAASGIFQVKAGEQGLIVRGGKLLPNRDGGLVYGPGMYWAMPDPFDEKIRLPGQPQILVVSTFVFERRKEDVNKSLSEIEPTSGGLKPGRDGAMLTGDKNLSHGLWTVHYQIADAAQFVKNVKGDSAADFAPLLQRLTENAVVRATSYRRVEEITRTNITDVKGDVQSYLQKELDRLNTGVKITQLIVQAVEPRQVRDAFNGVAEAENERRRLIEEAKKKASEVLNQTAGAAHEKLLQLIQQYGAAQAVNADERRLEELRAQIDAELDRAGGQVAVQLQEARTRANDIRETINREVNEFQYYLPGYRKDQVLTTVRLWTQMRDEILSSKQNEIFFAPSFGALQILTNRDPQKTIDAEIQKYQNRNRPPGPSSPSGPPLPR